MLSKKISPKSPIFKNSLYSSFGKPFINNTLSIHPTLTLRMYTSDGELVEDSEQMITCGFVNYDTWGQVCVWFTPENKSYACSTYGWGTTSSSNVFWGTMLKGYKVEVDIHWNVDSGLDYTWKFTFK